MIGTLLAVLPVIGFLSRNIAALLPNVISSDPASELAETLSRGALYRATVSTGIADRVPAEHCRRSVIVAEDASVLIFGLGYNLDGRSDIWIARGRRHFARGLGIFLYIYKLVQSVRGIAYVGGIKDANKSNEVK